MYRRQFYLIKRFIPREVQLGIRKRWILKKLEKVHAIWPIDPSSSIIPTGWNGWPGGKKFALVLTHDVDSQAGQAKCRDLTQLEIEMGFRSSFNFVPMRYEVSSDLRTHLENQGFEVGVHGLYHDGKYFDSKKIWRNRFPLINKFITEWNAVGFRTPSMLHDLEMILDLDIEYDASTFDTDPFEPQPDGMKTIFPFWVDGIVGKRGFVELPYTLPQDFTLFILMQEKTIDIWKKKLDWIAAQGGMALINAHPDYMCFDSSPLGPEEYPISLYSGFLRYVRDTYPEQYFHVLPKELAKFWKKNYSNT